MSELAPTIEGMSSTPTPRDGTRSAAEVNAAIRAFWTRPGAHPAVPLTADQRAEYHLLLAELQQVERGDVAPAA